MSDLRERLYGHMALALGSSAKRLRLGTGTPSRVYQGSTAFWDSDAAAYIAAVEEEDGEPLELGVCAAYHNFVLGCKADGVWDDIKASCILAGARTLDGALVPLKGPQPTNNNFVSGDYNRETGLKGDGSTKYLDSNRPDNSDPQNDNHLSVFVDTPQTLSDAVMIGSAPYAATGAHQIFYRPPNSVVWVQPRNAGGFASITGTTYPSLVGYSRTASNALVFRAGLSSVTNATTSQTPTSSSICVFSLAGGSAASDARLAFYSIGEAIDLEKLNSRVSSLVTAIGAAI